MKKNTLKIRQLCLIISLLTSTVVNAENIRLQIEGLSWELEKYVCAQLSAIKNNGIVTDQQFRIRVDAAIRKILKTLGYYEPTINFNLRTSSIKDRQVLVAHIFLGNPVLIGGTRVVLHGAACMDRDYLELLATQPKVGAMLNHKDYDRFKKRLTNLAIQKGYFDSQFTKSQLGVVVKKRKAFWDIDYNSGERYRFGDVTFEGSQIRDEYLQNLIPFKKGDYYQSNKLGELSRRLSATGWFDSIVIPLEFDKARKTKVLSLHGMVSPCIKNTIETGIGYSTNVGPRIKATWKKPWMNSYGHSLTTSASVSTLEQQLKFSYKIPLLKNSLEQHYLLQGSFRRIDLNDTVQDSTTFVASRYWDLPRSWHQAIDLHWSFNHFIQANDTHTTILLYPGITISRIRSRGGLMPTWGDSQNYSIDCSNFIWGSDVDFSVLHAQNVWIRTIYDKHRFVIRSDLGWIETRNFERVPPDLRFFAGGDHSIRGYKYKSVSPKNEKGQLIGASKLVTGSLEYQYNVINKWWGAIFIDSGEAVNNLYESNFKISIGIGVRWQSPVGLIKFDLAVPTGDKNEHGLQLCIGLGPEL